MTTQPAQHCKQNTVVSMRSAVRSAVEQVLSL
jgi:hypothetical protein